MNRDMKEQTIQGLTEKIGRAKVAILINFQGLDVEKMNRLRKELKKASSELIIVKNTLFERASQGTNCESLNSYLHGPTGVTFGYRDVVASVNVLTKFKKDVSELGIKAGILGANVLGPQQIKELSGLPSREVLLGRLLALFKSAQTSLVNVLTATPRGLVTVLDGLRKKKETSSEAEG